HVMILSKNNSFVSQKLITIFNDFKKEKVEIFQVDRILSGKITLSTIKGTINSLLSEEFVSGNCDNALKLFDKKGVIRFDSIFEIANTPHYLRLIKGDFKKSISTIHLINNQLFIRSKNHGKLLPILGIELIHNFKRLK